jgi:hypothetical protein
VQADGEQRGHQQVENRQPAAGGDDDVNVDDDGPAGLKAAGAAATAAAPVSVVKTLTGRGWTWRGRSLQA